MRLQSQVYACRRSKLIAGLHVCPHSQSVCVRARVCVCVCECLNLRSQCVWVCGCDCAFACVGVIVRLHVSLRLGAGNCVRTDVCVYLHMCVRVGKV